MQVNLNCKLNSNGVIKFHSASLFACILYIELPNSVPLSISKRRLPSFKVYFCLILLNDRFASLVCFISPSDDTTISILWKLLFVSNNTTIPLLWKLVLLFCLFFFTLIKEIDITLRLNLKKKRPRNWESYTFSLLLKYQTTCTVIRVYHE